MSNMSDCDTFAVPPPALENQSLVAQIRTHWCGPTPNRRFKTWLDPNFLVLSLRGGSLKRSTHLLNQQRMRLQVRRDCQHRFCCRWFISACLSFTHTH